MAAPEGGTPMNGSPCIPSSSQTPKPHSARPMCDSFLTNSLTSYSSNLDHVTAPQMAHCFQPFTISPRPNSGISICKHCQQDNIPAQWGRGQSTHRGTLGVGTAWVTLPRGLEVVMEQGSRAGPPLIFLAFKSQGLVSKPADPAE